MRSYEGLVKRERLGKTVCNFRSIAVNLLTIDKVEQICSLKFNCESNVNPKCLWNCTRLTGRLLNKIGGKWMFF